MENKFDFLIGEMVMWKGMGEECLEDGYAEGDVENDFGLIQKVEWDFDIYRWCAFITWCDGTGGSQTFSMNKDGKIEFYNENMIYPVSENDL